MIANSLISTKKLLLFFFYLIYVMIITVTLSSINVADSTWLFLVTVIIAINFMIHILVFKVIEIKLFSMIGLFTIFLYLFHFGQVLLAGFFPYYIYQNYNYIKYFDPESLKETIFICVLFLNMMILGIILFNLTPKSAKKLTPLEATVDSQTGLDLCKKLGWITLLFSAPFQFYYDFLNIMHSYLGGYLATYSSDKIGIIYAFGNFIYVAFALLIIGYKDNKKKSIAFFLFFIVYIGIAMLTGNRGHQIVALIVIFYIASKTILKIKVRDILIIILICWLGSIFMNMIYDTRNIGIYYFLNNFSSLFLKHIGTNPFFEINGNFGDTIETPYLVVTQMDHSISPAFGLTYLYSFASLLPNLGGVFTTINQAANFPVLLNGSALGGSFIGEFFYNFKYYGIIPILIFGGILSKISNKFEDAFYGKDYFAIIFLLPIIINSLWWVRDSFANMVRPIIWQSLFSYFVLVLLKQRKVISASGKINKKSSVRYSYK
jgi:oligosaccharide repeat unit polymerase